MEKVLANGEQKVTWCPELKTYFRTIVRITITVNLLAPSSKIHINYFSNF